MNLLVIRPLRDSGLSSNSVANRISDRSFDVIDFITMPLGGMRRAQELISNGEELQYTARGRQFNRPF